MSQFASFSWDAAEAEALANEGRCVFRSEPAPAAPAPAAPAFTPETALDDFSVPGDDERRRHGRVPFRTRVSIHEIDDSGLPGPKIDCDAFDLSQSGLGVMAKRMFYRDKRLLIKLQLSAGKSRVLSGEVRYSRYADRGQYHVGIQFCPIPQSQAVRGWLQQNAPELLGGD
jgi:hypothetical protein